MVMQLNMTLLLEWVQQRDTSNYSNMNIKHKTLKAQITVRTTETEGDVCHTLPSMMNHAVTTDNLLQLITNSSRGSSRPQLILAK